MPPWCSIAGVEALPSPALVVYAERVERNLARMIEIAGSPDRLRPHIKTHKMAQVLGLKLAAGIRRFKCSTIAEAELAARAGAPDVLLAYQLVGPNLARYAQLVRAFPTTRFSSLVDDSQALAALEAALAAHGVSADVLLDIDCGMQRTGIAPGEAAAALYRQAAASGVVQPGGLHVYDGHIKAPSLDERRAAVAVAFAPVEAFRDRLRAEGLAVPQLVAGGTPTFGVHAEVPDRQLSPGTCVFWDACYAGKYPELGFEPAALVLTRVISRPAADLVGLDLGYKAVSPDNADPRVVLVGFDEARAAVHSEEHLTMRMPGAERLRLGDVVYGIPYHICPTVALHAEALVVRGGQVVDRWPVAARNRQLTF